VCSGWLHVTVKDVRRTSSDLASEVQRSRSTFGCSGWLHVLSRVFVVPLTVNSVEASILARRCHVAVTSLWLCASCPLAHA